MKQLWDYQTILLNALQKFEFDEDLINDLENLKIDEFQNDMEKLEIYLKNLQINPSNCSLSM